MSISTRVSISEMASRRMTDTKSPCAGQSDGSSEPMDVLNMAREEASPAEPRTLDVGRSG